MVEPVAAQLRVQAAHCARLGSPLYADLLERAATDAEEGGPVASVLRGHESDPPNSMLALRLMGAVHRRLLEGALPNMEWSTFRRALVDDAAAIRPLLCRPVQTNEVGRCAALLPGFLAVAKRTGMPLRLLEVGASAGLNLLWDRYRYESAGFAWGDEASNPRIAFELHGGPPVTTQVDVFHRRGCDLSPVDPIGEEGRLTLLSFVWADQADRLDRLRAALATAAELPVAVDRAGAAEWTAGQLSDLPTGVVTVLFHSIVMQYLPEDERLRFERLVRSAGEVATAAAPLAWLRMEPAGGCAEVRLACWPGGEDTVLARSGYHGNPVRLTG